jgi:hypothetical protein
LLKNRKKRNKMKIERKKMKKKKILKMEENGKKKKKGVNPPLLFAHVRNLGNPFGQLR